MACSAKATVEQCVKVYRECVRPASIVSGRLVKRDNACNLSTQWMQRDLERSENVNFERNHTVLCGSNIIRNDVPVELNSELLRNISPSGKLTAIIRKVTPKKGDEEKHYLEVWSKLNKIKNIDLLAQEKHGKVYNDTQFGCLEWSASEKKLLYIAEKKRPKTASYFESKPKEEDCDAKAGDDSKKDEPIKGDQFVHQYDWGEQLRSKSHPAICVVDIDAERVSVVNGVPEDVSPGQALWSPDDKGVVFVGWWHEPLRLGLVFCTNRRSAIFQVDIDSEKYEILSKEGKAVRSPRFNNDKSRLVYVQNQQGGPHMCCSELVMYDWKSKETSVVVPAVERPADSSAFPGLYLTNLPTRCWSVDNKRLVLHTIWRSKQELISVNTDNKKLTRLTNDPEIGCWTLVDIFSNCMVASTSSPNRPCRIVLGKLPADDQETVDITWRPFDEEVEQFSDISWEIQIFKPKVDSSEPRFVGLDYEAILLQPTDAKSTKKPTPMIVWPHGGPHSTHVAGYMCYTATLCRLGFSVLLVNFRGSLGFGQANIFSLPGNVGCQDVYDVQNAVDEVVAAGIADENSLVLCGGSHGGFLVTHMIGQFPGKYKACVTRNPVVNILSMYGSSDIPDWCSCENDGQLYDHQDLPDSKTYSSMLTKSPIHHAHKVVTPTMIMIGTDDFRVPPKQGHEFYRALKSRGVEVRLLVYPDNNHSLSKVDAEADAIVNIYKWFSEHLA